MLGCKVYSRGQEMAKETQISELKSFAASFLGILAVSWEQWQDPLAVVSVPVPHV